MIWSYQLRFTLLFLCINLHTLEQDQDTNGFCCFFFQNCGKEFMNKSVRIQLDRWGKLFLCTCEVMRHTTYALCFMRWLSRCKCCRFDSGLESNCTEMKLTCFKWLFCADLLHICESFLEDQKDTHNLRCSTHPPLLILLPCYHNDLALYKCELVIVICLTVVDGLHSPQFNLTLYSKKENIHYACHTCYTGSIAWAADLLFSGKYALQQSRRKSGQMDLC